MNYNTSTGCPLFAENEALIVYEDNKYLVTIWGEVGELPALDIYAKTADDDLETTPSMAITPAAAKKIACMLLAWATITEASDE